MRFVKLASLGAIGLLTAGLALAQQAQVAPAQKAQSSSAFMGPINQTPWFSNPGVRQQLNLNDTQFNQLNKAHTGAWTQYQQGLKTLSDNSTLTAQQRSQQMQDLQQNFYKSLASPINDTLTDPQMRTRYNQLYTQYRGYDAFQDPTIQSKLNLTAEQQQKLNQFNQDWRKSMGNLSNDFQKDPQAATQRFNELRKQEADRMNGVLTDQQRQMWQQMTGNPYNFQPSVYFPSTTSSLPR